MDLKLGHYRKDGFEVVTVEGEIDIYTATFNHAQLSCLDGIRPSGVPRRVAH